MILSIKKASAEEEEKDNIFVIENNAAIGVFTILIYVF
jgi:hypothetical protein